MAKMGDAGNALNIVILDACRDNPFTRMTRSGTRGPARMVEPVDTLVAFAAEPGAVAEDGKGRNGMYTTHLLLQMRRPGLQIEQVFKNVRVAVMEETQNTQRPQEWSMLRRDFVFVSAAPAAPAPRAPGRRILPGRDGHASHTRVVHQGHRGLRFGYHQRLLSMV